MSFSFTDGRVTITRVEISIFRIRIFLFFLSISTQIWNFKQSFLLETRTSKRNRQMTYFKWQVSLVGTHQSNSQSEKVLFTSNFCIFSAVPLKNADVSRFCDVTHISLNQKCNVLVLGYIHAKFQDSTTYQPKVSGGGHMTPPRGE